jgi:hypothetical protein
MNVAHSDNRWRRMAWSRFCHSTGDVCGLTNRFNIECIQSKKTQSMKSSMSVQKHYLGEKSGDDIGAGIVDAIMDGLDIFFTDVRNISHEVRNIPF